MKTIVLLMGAMFSIITCDAWMHHRSGMVPEAALTSFSKQYPQQSAKKWEVRHDTCIAEFNMSKRKQSAYYFANGGWIKTETRIPWTKDLPDAVKNSWNQCAFASWRIDKIDEVQTGNKNTYTMVVYQDCGPDGSLPGDCE